MKRKTSEMQQSMLELKWTGEMPKEEKDLDIYTHQLQTVMENKSNPIAISSLLLTIHNPYQSLILQVEKTTSAHVESK